MHPEKYTLTWHSYPDYLMELMREMLTSEDFTDVTLVTDDKMTIKAHRNILSACSPVFKNILQMEITNNHPVIYLRGIQYSEMESILQFIYFGQAKLYEEQMNKFMLLSKNLEIKGLIKDADVNEPQIKQSCQNQEDVTDTVNVDHNNINDHEEVMVSTIESDPTDKNEVTSKELTKLGSKFQCPKCDKSFLHSRSVHIHIRSAHEGVRYACSQCDYQATKQSHLTVHIQSKHEDEGVMYACNQCEYQAKQRSNLTIHIQSKHEGVKYACNQCDYQATHPGTLTRHIQSVHEGVKYACSQCDHQATTQSHLKKHFQRKHL